MTICSCLTRPFVPAWGESSGPARDPCGGPSVPHSSQWWCVMGLPVVVVQVLSFLYHCDILRVWVVSKSWRVLAGTAAAIECAGTMADTVGAKACGGVRAVCLVLLCFVQRVSARGCGGASAGFVCTAPTPNVTGSLPCRPTPAHSASLPGFPLPKHYRLHPLYPLPALADSHTSCPTRPPSKPSLLCFPPPHTHAHTHQPTEGGALLEPPVSTWVSLGRLPSQGWLQERTFFCHARPAHDLLLAGRCGRCGLCQ